MPFSTESVTTRPVDQLAQLGDQPRQQQQQDTNNQGRAGTRPVAQVSPNTNSALKLAEAATPSVPPHANDKVASELRPRANAVTERPAAGYQNPYSTTKHAKLEVFDHIKEVPNDPTYSKLNESQEVIEAQAEGLYGGLESPEDRTYESIDYDPKDHEYAELENVRFQAMRNIDQRGEANL